MRIRLISAVLVLASCSASNFAGSSAKKKDTDLDRDNVPPPTTTNATTNAEVGTETATGTNSGNVPGLITDEGQIAKLKTECWFAVSGAYLGSDYYPSTFPNTHSGKPPGHLETFDEVGGVFLEARDAPYIDGQGPEISEAVKHSFDSIAIAPGMRAVIKDAAGAIVYEGKGPQFLLSSEYQAAGNLGAWNRAVADYERKVAQFPDWMQTILKARAYKPETVKLQSASSVLVSKVAGERCYFK